MGSDSGVKGVIIRIDSPGGEVTASDEMWREMNLLSKKKPLVISMSDVAASGGYYMAMTGDPIVAYPQTETGSIGVVFAGFGFPRLLEKIGVERRVHTAGESKVILDPFQPEKAEDVVRAKLARKEKIPGFGHRVYHTEDPRATHLRVLSEELGRRTGHTDMYLMSRMVEDTIKQEKHLNANVDFYSASTYYSLGIPVDLFTPVFAISRMSGWTAHVLEQYHNNRLIRPRAEYKGNPDGMRWIPMADR